MLSLSLSVLAVAVPLASGYAFPDCVNGPLAKNAVCDTSKDANTRATALVQLFTPQELINNTVNGSPGVPRLGLPAYQWWSEALHGVASSPGVTFAPSGNFSSATSFPQPILMSAAFDDDLIEQVASVVSTEARAFNNFGRAGLDFWTPNINPFKDPRWGRGQETPGEDPFRISGYVNSLIRGLQGGVQPQPYLKVISTCKHFSGYDLEDWENNPRYGFNAIITQQDLVEYYLPPFQACVRDAKVETIMCSYNAVNGIPSCADNFLIQNVLRDFWGLRGWVVSDCDAIGNIFNDHHYTATFPEAAADALKAGTDINCGTTYAEQLPAALNQSLITVKDLQTALVRQYASLVRLGYFDPASSQPYRQLAWSDVNLPSSQQLAHRAAVESIVLLKNDGTLPLKSSQKTKIALIGPMGNASTQMQGNYQGVAPYLITPLTGLTNAGFDVTFSMGTNVTSNDTTNFGDALSVAKSADIIVFIGGIDETIEREAMDRLTITWPDNQMALIQSLEKVGKPLVIVQFGGGQIDGSALKASSSVNGMLWVGYPGQSGGTAIAEIISGKVAPAGRLPVTQYPAAYVDEIPMTNMNLRPSSSSPGRTYKWYTGKAVFPFAFGLHYTTFGISFGSPKTPSSFNIQSIINNAHSSSPVDTQTFHTFPVNVKNTGKVTSDFVLTLFITKNAGPAPHPNSELASYTRIKSLSPGQSKTVQLPVSIGSIGRVDENGNLWVYPGTYQVHVDSPSIATSSFTLTGKQQEIIKFPQRK